ncbi:hypothetical protein TcWFU_000054 [Taenia crassiceps]|uniref:Cytochrome P450 n=1 Tax=Taenia crassiceps TaxID=6207 RepID=A0ABR4QIR3_9CEST
MRKSFPYKRLCILYDELEEPNKGKLGSLPIQIPNYTTVSSRLGSRVVVVISKWAKIEESRDDLRLRRYFSGCASSFSLGWKGLVFSDPFTVEYSRLNDFFEFASQAFPASIFIGASNRGVGAFLGCAPEQIVLTSDTLNQLVLQILFEAIMHPSWDKRTHRDAISKLGELSNDLFQLHTSRHLPKNIYVGAGALTRAVDRLIEPFVLLELHRDTSNRPGTLLSYLLWTKRTLSLSQPIDDQKSEDMNGFLTKQHITHLSFESFFLGYHSLIPCLRTLLAALTSRPGWCQRLLTELSEHQRSCPSRCRKHTATLTEECFDLETRCLSFTKALCLEALRFTVVGWPLGCLREAFRDGEEFLAGDLVLLNEPAVFHDPTIWFKECQMPVTGEPLQHAFAPMGRHGRPDANYLASRVLLNSKVCFLPRAFPFRLLLATAVHLFTQCSFRQAEEEPDEFWDLPLILPLDFSLMRCATLCQNDRRA